MVEEKKHANAKGYHAMLKATWNWQHIMGKCECSYGYSTNELFKSKHII